ncbi:MAG TPA: hypothetical protein VHB77_12085 [Planctomycetaceae bacterium]|nr:hypothetical protein [Planctomycetaceae bacterium]
MNALPPGPHRKTFRVAAGLLLAATCWLPGPVHAQAQKGEPEFIPGTLVSLEKDKGKNHAMKMKRSDNEEEMTFIVGPKVPYRIVFKGDAGYLQPNAVVAAHVVQKGMDYSTTEVTVYLVSPPALSSKEGPKQGENKTYDIVGKVVSANSDSFTVETNNSRAKVSLDKGTVIWVTGVDPVLAKPGSEVNVEGLMLRKDKFNPTSIEIKVTEALPYEEYEKLVPDKKSTSKRSTKKPTKKDDADGDDDSPKKKKPVRKKPVDPDASY